MANTIKRRSLLVILSDCLDRIEPLANAFRHFRHAKHEVIVFHIVAPEEDEFPFNRPTQFRNIERSSHRTLVDPHQIRARYLERYREFCDELAHVCGSSGVDYQKLLTNVPYHVALGAFLDARSRRKAKSSR